MEALGISNYKFNAQVVNWPYSSTSSANRNSETQNLMGWKIDFNQNMQKRDINLLL